MTAPEDVPAEADRLVPRLFRRILSRLRRRPSARDWLFLAATAPVWAVATWGFLHASGFFALARYPFTTRHLLLWSLIYLIMPSVLEEVIYRPPFFPPGLRLASRAFAWRCAASTAVFVAAHPLNAWLFLPGDLPVFSDARFLLAVALLGVYCSILLVHTGSVWCGVLVHYALVMGWKFGFCGVWLGW